MSSDFSTLPLGRDDGSGIFRPSACTDHVLIIEDQALIAMVIEDHLRGLGYSSFDFATNFDDAIALACTRCPDLITADVRLELGCGIDAINEICHASVVPTLFITGSSYLVRQRCVGAALIEKPFGLQDFICGVRQAYEVSARING